MPGTELDNLLTLCYEGSFDETHFTDKETKTRIPLQDHMIPKPVILTTVLFWIFCLYPVFSPLFLGPHPSGEIRGEKKCLFLSFFPGRFLKNEALDPHSSVNKLFLRKSIQRERKGEEKWIGRKGRQKY